MPASRPSDPPRRRYTTYLVAVTPERGDREGAPVVYAAMKRDPQAALEAVRLLTDGAATVAIVGSLSTRTAKAIKLKPDKVRMV